MSEEEESYCSSERQMGMSNIRKLVCGEGRVEVWQRRAGLPSARGEEWPFARRETPHCCRLHQERERETLHCWRFH